MVRGGDKNPTKAALESKKTVSKRLQEKLSTQVSSRATSNAGSNPASRIQSRQVTDDEDDGYESDSTNAMSIGSWADRETRDLPEVGHGDFKLLIEELLERKGSTIGGRELALRRYAAYLSRHVATSEVEPKVNELMGSFLKSIRSHESELEVCLALRAIAITLFTASYQDEDIFRVLKQQIVFSEEAIPIVRATAIHTLAAAAAFGGAGEDEMIEIMDEFIRMLTDDDIADKKNDAPFAAACKEWAFLATYIDDIQDLTEPAMTAFTRQLHNNDADVMISAGDAIALIYEKSFTERESDDTPPTKQEIEQSQPIDLQYVERYPIFDDFQSAQQLKDRVQDLAAGSKYSLRVSSSHKKDLSKKFRDVLETINHPARGPGWRSAYDQETGLMYGHSMKHRIGAHGKLHIERWWTWHRYEALKRVLAGGDFIEHYEHNPAFIETLP